MQPNKSNKRKTVENKYEERKGNKEGHRQVIRTRRTPLRCYRGPSNGAGCEWDLLAGTCQDIDAIQQKLSNANRYCRAVKAHRPNSHLPGEKKKIRHQEKEGSEDKKHYSGTKIETKCKEQSIKGQNKKQQKADVSIKCFAC